MRPKFFPLVLPVDLGFGTQGNLTSDLPSTAELSRQAPALPQQELSQHLGTETRENTP